MAKETIGKTISVAAGVCVVCSVFVSTASVVLKDRQEINKKLDKRKNILRAAGVLGEKENVRDLLKRRIKEGVLEKDATLDDLFYNEVDERWVGFFKNVDGDLLKRRIKEGVLKKDATLDDLFRNEVDKKWRRFYKYNTVDKKWVRLKAVAFVDEKDVEPEYRDERKAAKDPRLRVEIEPGADTAGFKYKAPFQRIYFTKQGAGQPRIILPVHGKGLWSTMYWFIALDAADLDTILSFSFYEHGETPGLGGEVDAEDWKASWIDKKAFDEGGKVAIKVVKGKADKGALDQVDGLSGATLTANGVEKLVKFWLDDEGYGPLLEQLAAEGGTR